MDDTFETLATQIPGAPEGFQGLLQHAEHLDASLHHLTDSLTQMRQQCEQRLGTLATAIQALQSSAANTVPAQMTQGLAVMEQRLEALRHSASTGQEVLAASVQRLQAKTAALQERLHQGHERLAQAALQARQAVSATQEQVQAAEQRLLAAFGDSATAVRDLQGQLEQVEVATVTHVDTLQQALQRLQGEVDTTLQHTHEAGLVPLPQGVTERLAALHREHITAPVEELLQRTQHDLAEQLRQGVDAMLQQLSSAVRDIERQFSDSRDSSALQRGILQPVLDELQQVWDPVKDASDAVHDLARSLGVG
jgi:hypothetical protein